MFFAKYTGYDYLRDFVRRRYGKIMPKPANGRNTYVTPATAGSAGPMLLFLMAPGLARYIGRVWSEAVESMEYDGEGYSHRRNHQPCVVGLVFGPLGALGRPACFWGFGIRSRASKKRSKITFSLHLMERPHTTRPMKEMLIPKIRCRLRFVG